MTFLTRPSEPPCSQAQRAQHAVLGGRAGAAGPVQAAQGRPPPVRTADTVAVHCSSSSHPLLASRRRFPVDTASAPPPRPAGGATSTRRRAPRASGWGQRARRGASGRRSARPTADGATVASAACLLRAAGCSPCLSCLLAVRRRLLQAARQSRPKLSNPLDRFQGGGIASEGRGAGDRKIRG